MSVATGDRTLISRMLGERSTSTPLQRPVLSSRPVTRIMRLAVELSQPVFTTQVCRDQGSNPNLPHARRTLYLYATAAVCTQEQARHFNYTLYTTQ